MRRTPPCTSVPLWWAWTPLWAYTAPPLPVHRHRLPRGAYYPEGLDPVKIYVEDQDVRASRAAPAPPRPAATTPASLRAGDRAEAQGYSQVLWLDGVHRKYIERSAP